MEQQRAPVLGIVGGVGSGKSAVGRWIVARARGRLIDADRIGHDVLQREDIKAALRRTFGESIFTDGEVDRRQLGSLVFGDTAQAAPARKTLESIVHPVLGQTIREQIAAAQGSEDVDLIVLDAAILLETGWREICDLVAFIDAPRQQRLQRVGQSRGWTADELARREASQWPLDRKRAAADIIIDNSGTVEAAGRQLMEFLIAQGRLRQTTSSLETASCQVDAPRLS